MGNDQYMDHVISVGEKMVSTANKAEIPKRYQLILGELNYLYEMIKKEGDPYNALCMAYDYGFVKGCRATRKGKTKTI